MHRALVLARYGWGRVSPNPLVGAVVVRDGRVVGEGFHAEFGGDHAEVAALKGAGPAARGATLYVSLEPCVHHGQTPPCSTAITEAGIRRVVVGARDPNPIASGGLEALAGAGVEVVTGVLVDEAVRLNAPFLWKHRNEGPWVTLKLGLSADARIAARPGERTRVTGPEAQDFVHRLRAGADAVLVGGRTAWIDDPLLTVRCGTPPRVPPRRVVLDPRLELSPESKLIRTVEEAPVMIFGRKGASPERAEALEAKGARIRLVEGDGDHHLSLTAVLATLAAEDAASVLIEGGGRLATALLERGLVHRQYLIYTETELGPPAVPAFDRNLDPIGPGWSVVRREPLGADTLVEIDKLDALGKLREAA
jgi:diaminohydroxyphosphoribosylaminopyrimidine deaminase/5-amino-6-(5-phosphoribosylamino)uracil reductase